MRTKSEEIYLSLCEVIPGGVNSPVRACKSVGQLPLIAESGLADIITDVDGKTYIDYCGSWGALIHGHAHPQILEAVNARMQKGTSFGITTNIENALAREVINIVPSIEKLRFVSSGTEATMSAIRLARGYTGKKFIIKFIGHYHGHADSFLVQAGSGVMGLGTRSSSAGIPEAFVQYTLCLPFNDEAAFLDAIKNFGEDLAAVILEPIAGNMGVVPTELKFMELLRKETEKVGALLIFDEVMTGFRVAKQGAQAIYSQTPDLICLGKIVGGGFPAAAFGGKAQIMNCLSPLGSVYQAGTLSGNPVAMEAGLESLKLLQVPGFYESLQEKVDLLVNPLRDFIEKEELPICIQSVGSMLTIFFGKRAVRSMEDVKSLDFDLFACFFRYLFENGVYIPPLQQEAWFISAAHTEENIIRTRELIITFLQKNLCCTD